MKKLLLIVCAFILAAPVPFTKAVSPGLVVKPVHYTNKSPFILEGFAQAGSEIEIHGQGTSFIVGNEGSFRVELKADEGINLFAITASKDGASSTKGFMVEMDSTPPEVTLLVKDKPTQEKSLKIEIFDASEFAITGFTEPGCQILADEVDYSTGNVKFEAKFKVGAAPSKSNHKLEIIDKFGNKTEFDINAINAHIRTVVLQLGNSIATIDGMELDLPVPPTIIKGTTMIPLRSIVEQAFDGYLEYFVVTKTIAVTVGDKKLLIQINSSNAVLNNNEIIISGTPPTAIKGSTMVPFRFIGEEFGFLVSWKNETKTITMTKPIYE